jgi:hypothetical protein
MAKADGARLQCAEQRRTKPPMLQAIGDRERELATSPLTVEAVACLCDDGIAAPLVPFRELILFP